MIAFETRPVVGKSTPDPHELLGTRGGPASTLERRYEKLSQRWAEETAFTSWMEHILTSPAGLRIAALGLEAVPLLEGDLRRGHNERAVMGMLRVVLGDGPEIPEVDRGRLAREREHWLRWLGEHTTT